jgi:hypothetical protein
MAQMHHQKRERVRASRMDCEKRESDERLSSDLFSARARDLRMTTRSIQNALEAGMEMS